MTEQEFRLLVADKIAYYRNSLGITQVQLAEHLNYSDKSVSKWERGEGMPDAFVLKELADYFGISVDDLVSDRRPVAIGNKKKRKNFIVTLSVFICWLSAGVIFFILQMLPWNIPKTWLVFVYALIPSFIVLTVFSCIWYKLIHRALSVSGIIWSVFLSLLLTFYNITLFDGKNIIYFLIPCAVFQAMVIIWFIMRHKTRG